MFETFHSNNFSRYSIEDYWSCDSEMGKSILIEIERMFNPYILRKKEKSTLITVDKWMIQNYISKRVEGKFNELVKSVNEQFAVRRLYRPGVVYLAYTEEVPDVVKIGNIESKRSTSGILWKYVDIKYKVANAKAWEKFIQAYFMDYWIHNEFFRLNWKKVDQTISELIKGECQEARKLPIPEKYKNNNKQSNGVSMGKYKWVRAATEGPRLEEFEWIPDPDESIPPCLKHNCQCIRLQVKKESPNKGK
jgi:hypothetical protein